MTYAIVTIIKMHLQISCNCSPRFGTMKSVYINNFMLVLLLALLSTVYGQEPTNRPSNGK